MSISWEGTDVRVSDNVLAENVEMLTTRFSDVFVGSFTSFSDDGKFNNQTGSYSASSSFTIPEDFVRDFNYLVISFEIFYLTKTPKLNIEILDDGTSLLKTDDYSLTIRKSNYEAPYLSKLIIPFKPKSKHVTINMNLTFGIKTGFTVGDNTPFKYELLVF